MSPTTLPKYIKTSGPEVRRYRLFLEYTKDLSDPDSDSWKYRVCYISDSGILNIFENRLLSIIETEIYDYCKKNNLEFKL